MGRTGLSSVITERVFQWWDYPLFVFLSIFSVWAIFSLLLHWFSLADWAARPISFSIMTVILLVILANNQGRWFLLPFMRKPRPMPARPGWKVAVVTTFVPAAEPLEMLEDTLKALAGQDYPHDTWVLDEGNDEKVKALCARLGVRHFSRKKFPQYQTGEGTFQSASKHGNYNAWLYEVGFEAYDIISTFDPDHAPDSDFLCHVLGYFDDEKVAYVQVAQTYYNQKASFIARGAAEETYAYYSSVQTASYGMGYPVIVGCHNTHRVAALKQVGGLAAHDAEDLLLTLQYQASGWNGIYVPQILARGLTPVDWASYLRQQRRWARSVLDIKLRHYSKLSKGLSFPGRLMSFLHGLNYLHRAGMIFLGFFLISFVLATGRVPSVVSYLTIQKLVVLWAVLQVCEFYRQRFYLDWPNECGFHWRVALLQYAKWPWFLFALLDVLLNKQKPYVLTPKVKSKSRKRLLLLPNLLVIVLLCSAWVVGWILERNIHPLVYLCAAMLLIASAILIWTDFWEYPPPYQRELRSNQTPECDHRSSRQEIGVPFASYHKTPADEWRNEVPELPRRKAP